MSVLPLLDDPFGNKFEKVFEDEFGHRFHPEQIYHSLDTRQPSMMHSNLLPDIYQRHHCVPRRNPRQAANLTKSIIDKDGFQLCMDVHRFQPNEITVKTVNNSIVVEGKHEVKEDEHGQIYRHFVRRYELPKQCDVKDVVSLFSSDGILTIKAPPKSQENESNERKIQIQYTGPAHLTIKPIIKTEK